MRLVLEGLTGAGKTHTLTALRRRGALPPNVFSEDETFGDAMDEVGSPAVLRRLAAVCDRLEATSADAFLLERAHPSYVAVGVPWEACMLFDERLAALGAKVVLLVVPEERLVERSLRRREYGATDWQGFVGRFGSEAAAIEALRRSQARRVDVSARSRLPHLLLDTADEDWDRIADAVLAFTDETRLTDLP